MTPSEAALEAALGVIAGLPGAELHVEDDATWVAGARPLEGLNHVLRAQLAGDDMAIERRIDDLDAGLRRRGSVPATWWIGPSTTPADLDARLARRRFVETEPEYGMVLDLTAWRERPVGSDVEIVGDAAGLDAFLSVMAGAYGWTDDGRSSAWAELYRLPAEAAEAAGAEPADADRTIRHVVVRRDGRPAACASLFSSDGHAFVTNVGTIPAARGQGLGTLATLAVVDIAARQGTRWATLTASRMGRGVYLRIGFREDALLRRMISPA